VIKKHFGQLTGSGPKPDCPEFGLLDHRGIEVFYSHEPEIGKVNISLETFWDLAVEDDSIDLQKRNLLQHIGTMVMGYRLEQILEQDTMPFSYGRYQAGDIIQRIGYGALAVQTDESGWKGSLAMLVQTLRQALKYGFTGDEVERAKKEITADLESRVITESSQNSRQIARKIIHHLNRNRVYQSPAQEQELYAPMISLIGVDAVNSAFRQIWNRSFRLISVTGDVELNGDSAVIIEEAYQDSLTVKVSLPEEPGKINFPYLLPPDEQSQPQKIVREDIGLETLVFPNGLVVNLKQTDFENDRFLLTANFGRGEEDEPSPGMAIVATDVINGSGSGRLTKPALDGLVAGSSVDISFRAGESFFAWSGSGLVKDFELFLQLLYTLLHDPGFRGNVFTRVMSNYELKYQKMEREIEGADALHIQPFLATYNEHFGLPSWENLKKSGFNDLQGWVHSVIRPKDLEISVVGDFDPGEIGALLTKYFGSIALEGFDKVAPSIVKFPAGQQLEVDVATTMDKALIAVAWPTEDFWDIRRTRRLQVLASVFRDRLRESIREKLGASYSPGVSSFGSRTYKDYGYIKTEMVVQPGSEDMVIDEILKISEELRRQGIETDELVRAREPMLTELTGTVKTNRYWLYSVLSLSSRNPQQLEWPKSMLSDYGAVSVEDLNALAASYLENSRAAVIRVRPENDEIQDGEQRDPEE
jgi:zinc protease